MIHERINRVLLLVAVVLACGGGCMSMPYAPFRKADLALIGVDERVRARVDGLADPRPNDPKPIAGLTGSLVVVHLAYARYPRQLHPGDEPIERLSGLDGIVHASVLRLDLAKTIDGDVVTNDLKQMLLDQARDVDADLILVFTSADSADAFDLTLTLAQVLTLGFAPTVVVTTDAKIEAVLLDAHTGYAYAISEAEAGGSRLANGWSREADKRRTADDATREAFDKLVDQLEAAWPKMRQAYP